MILIFKVGFDSVICSMVGVLKSPNIFNSLYYFYSTSTHPSTIYILFYIFVYSLTFKQDKLGLCVAENEDPSDMLAELDPEVESCKKRFRILV